MILLCFGVFGAARLLIKSQRKPPHRQFQIAKLYGLTEIATDQV
jgi:hypothetical protein